jgi:hypothetical protein
MVTCTEAIMHIEVDQPLCIYARLQAGSIHSWFTTSCILLPSFVCSKAILQNTLSLLDFKCAMKRMASAWIIDPSTGSAANLSWQNHLKNADYKSSFSVSSIYFCVTGLLLYITPYFFLYKMNPSKNFKFSGGGGHAHVCMHKKHIISVLELVSVQINVSILLC